MYSGDTGFYSGAAGAGGQRLRAQGERPVTVLPGLSSVQLLWPRRWAGRGRTGSSSRAHGRACAPAAECLEGPPDVLFDGRAARPAPPRCVPSLAAAGLWNAVPAAVGENLGTPEQKGHHRHTVGQRWRAAAVSRALSVLLVEAGPRPPPRRAQGLPDEAFMRGAKRR